MKRLGECIDGILARLRAEGAPREDVPPGAIVGIDGLDMSLTGFPQLPVQPRHQEVRHG